jgi:Carboxypeptidase regulatory-like domain
MSDYVGRIWVLCGLLAAATTVSAQQAQLSGFVKDPAGSAVSNATASIQNVATSWCQSTASNDAGRFTLALVRPGVYRLTVEASGFEKAVIEDLRIDVGSKIERDVTLQLGSVSQSVTVDGSGIAVNTTDASVSTIVDRKFVENIPLNGRSFQSLLTLVPGVALVPSARRRV